MLRTQWKGGGWGMEKDSYGGGWKERGGKGWTIDFFAKGEEEEEGGEKRGCLHAQGMEGTSFRKNPNKFGSGSCSDMLVM